MSEPVKVSCYPTEDGHQVGVLTLDSPASLNALSLPMIQILQQTLTRWEQDSAIVCVLLQGAGEKAFCAGGDIRSFYYRKQEASEAELFGYARDFFEQEYRLDALIANYPKPVTARLHGISMGGGLGLALHASRVVVEVDLVLAMPETTIGLFPDVGVDFEVSRMPRQTGAWLVMTGESVDAFSAQWAGLVHEALGVADSGPTQLELDAEWIEPCFSGDDAAAVLAALESHPDERARNCAALIRTKSPLSVCVALEALRRAESMATVDEVLAQDLVLARNFVADSDFVEGVRAQLVDKDRTPQWRHARIEDVPRELVGSMFEA